MPKTLFSLILLALAALCFSGCRTAELPPGFSRVGSVLQNHTSQAASPAAVYALMEWYDEHNRDRDIPPLWLQYVTDNRRQALDGLHDQWQKLLIETGCGLVNASSSQFIELAPDTLASRTNWSAINAQLHNLKTLITTPYTVTIPLAECQDPSFWKKASPDLKQAFLDWAHNRTLNVPAPPHFNADDCLRQIENLQCAVTMKQLLLQDLDQARTYADEHRYLEAMDLLDTRLSNLPDITRTLEAIHDRLTPANLRETAAELPIRCLDHHIDTLKLHLQPLSEKAQRPFDAETNSPKTLENSLATLETEASAYLTKWRQDKRFAKAWELRLPSFRHQATNLAQIRLAIWRHQFQTLTEHTAHWDASNQLATWKNDLNTLPAFSLYTAFTVGDNSERTPAQSITDDLNTLALSLLPKALDDFTAAAEKSLNVNHRPGFTFALCHMANIMTDRLPVTTHPDLQNRLQSLQNLAQKAASVIEDTVLKRTIAIADLASPIPGMGLTYTRDLTHTLQTLLQTHGLANLLQLTTTADSDARYGYTLSDGVVADFDGKETVERQTTRLFRRYGEIRQSANPKAKNDPAEPPSVYTQELYEQLINVREVERIAHIRAFTNLRGPGFTTLVEINEFYSKQFIIEESHPFNDLRIIDVLKSYDLTKHPLQDAEPTLQYDRVWTPGEMLDWARRDSLNALSLKILFHLNQFPFMLDAQARFHARNNNLADAAEQHACCFLLLRKLPIDSLTADALRKSAPSIAKCYDETLTELRNQHDALLKLRQEILNNMTSSANAFFMTGKN